MYLSKEEKNHIIQELIVELHAKPDGSGKNLIVPTCPYCGREGGKFGIYIGVETERKNHLWPTASSVAILHLPLNSY